MRIDPLVFTAKFPPGCHLDKCKSRCCKGGVWADVEERRTILSNSSLFLPYLRPECSEPSTWFGREEPDEDCPSGTAVETNVIGKACVFFHFGHGCALQKAAVDAGLHEWHYKPRFCIMFPLVVSGGALTVDEDMRSVWCMKAENRTHPVLAAVRKEVEYLFDDKVARLLLSSPRGNGAGGPKTVRRPAAGPAVPAVRARPTA